MANGIPPFLPASPPPMCKLDFYEDDDDDFGDFSNAAENCYQDNISITKSIADDEVNNASQVFDPGSNYKSSNETLINNHEYSIDNFVHQDTPISLTVQNNFNYEKSTNGTDITEEINNPHQTSIQNNSVEENDSSSETVPEFNIDDSRAYINDDDSSVEDSTSDSFDKNVTENPTSYCFNSDNNLHSENHINDETNKIENNFSSEVLDSEFNIPESNSIVENDYGAFCNVPKPEEILANDATREQTEENLEQAFSDDSDDSNTPDIDFNCFITCPQDLDSKQTNDDFADFHVADESCEDDFGDFVTPAEVDFKTYPSSSVQLDQNTPHQVQSSCLDTKPTSQVTTDLSSSSTLDPMDDDFSDFVSTTTPPSIENAKNSHTEQMEFLDQPQSLKKHSSEANSSPSTFAQADFTTVATTSSSSDLEKTYDLSSECWNEIFQGSGEEQIEVNLNTFEGKLNGSSVWCKMKDIETSPALSYNWNNSETQKMLLSALYVDSRNILFGPRWNSDVPRFASNLGFSPLVPEKATEKKDPLPVSISPPTVLQEDPVVDDNAPKVPASVPEAHFDWNTSGLTNPLDNHSHSSLLDLDLLASFDIHSPYYKNNRKIERTKPSGSSSYENSLAKTPHRKELSEEAKDILNNLPNLYVMEKQYIVFPVS